MLNSCRHRCAAIASLALLLFCGRADAWGFKEHIQITRLAVNRLIAAPDTPPEMKAWLKTLQPAQLSMAEEKQWFLTAKVGEAPTNLTPFESFVVQPDVRAKDRKARVLPLNLPERVMHYIDMELFLPPEASKKYKHDLSAKAKPTDIPREPTDERWIQAGALPYAVQYSQDQLSAALKAGKLVADPAKPDDENYAAKWAGYLAHYAQDNCQPLHSTEDFQAASYFADKRNAPKVHSEFEWRMADDAEHEYPQLRAAFWSAFEEELAKATDPVKSDDAFNATIEVASLSYDALPLIGTAAQASAGQAGMPNKPEGKPTKPFDIEQFFAFEGDVRGEKTTVLRMKAKQQAWAVLRTERLLKQAWDKAQAK